MSPPEVMATPPPVAPARVSIIQDWYWIVAGSMTQVYSSKVSDYVPVNNTAYTRWLAAGNVATRINSEADLGDLLAVPDDMTLRPNPPGVLDGYSNTVSVRITATYVNKLLFEYENRLRTLEGQPAMTAQEFRQKIKAMV